MKNGRYHTFHINQEAQTINEDKNARTSKNPGFDAFK